jgi:regulator of protease activity HflC (stomatin/prohibitin superfamily)
MKAEREKRSIELNAMAEKEAVIRKAEAIRQGEFLKAEAIERMADAKKYDLKGLIVVNQLFIYV